MRILIADDNETVRRVLRTYLERAGIEVCAEARDGREAIDKAFAFEPDLLILDVLMPELTGIEVAAVLKPSLPRTKIILFTMFAERIGESLAAAAGIDVIVAKPEQFHRLFGVIDSLLGSATDNEQHETTKLLNAESERTTILHTPDPERDST